jgi:DNA replication protein DnaC
MTTVTLTLPLLLRELCLPTFAREYAVVAEHAAHEELSHEAYLQILAMQEASDRTARRVERLIVDSKLPRGKSLATFDGARLPPKVRTALATLREGTFLDQATNVLVFGNPGTGKTHLVCGLGLEPWTATNYGATAMAARRLSET